MKIYQVVLPALLAGLVVGCATANKDVSDTTSPQYGKAYLRYNAEEVIMVSVDGKPYPKPTLPEMFTGNGRDMYIQPGKHKVTALLYFQIVGFSTTVSRIPKSVCFTAGQGKTYDVGAEMLNANHPLPNRSWDWKPGVSEFKTAFEQKPVGEACP